MNNPHAIQIHCDGAMDYDTKQTGGNGFIIEFPDSFELEPIAHFIRNDGQGINRLELISLIEAMTELLVFGKKNPLILKKASGVELYTDRFNATDNKFTNRYRIKDWRRNGWMNYENKPIKDRDLLDKIDKTRVKLEQTVGGSVSINYVPEKRNKVADKLSKFGKKTDVRGRKLIEKKQRRVIKRLYDGPEVNYSQLDINDIKVRVYAWEPVGDQFEICFEVCSGDFEGKTIKAYVNAQQKSELQRGHKYILKISKVFKHHIEINVSIKEIT